MSEYGGTKLAEYEIVLPHPEAAEKKCPLCGEWLQSWEVRAWHLVVFHRWDHPLLKEIRESAA